MKMKDEILKDERQETKDEAVKVVGHVVIAFSIEEGADLLKHMHTGKSTTTRDFNCRLTCSCVKRYVSQYPGRI